MSLRSEIRSIQSQIKSAIHNHQMTLYKLKDRPTSIKLRVQMSNVQRNIVSLGEKQKKLLQQLRKELEASGTAVKMEEPIYKPMQNLTPNPMNPLVSSKPLYINKKEPDLNSHGVREEVLSDSNINETSVGGTPLKPETISQTSRRKSKLVATVDLPLRNGHNITPSSSPSQKENTPSSTPSSSPTHNLSSNKQSKQSANKIPKQEQVPATSTSDESQDAYIHLPADPELRRKLQFMTALSLVTREVLAELQNRRTERKRRSTANSQYLYGNNSEQAMKRKKPTYLASGGATPANVPRESEVLVKPLQNPVCLSCSSSNGTLSQCSACQKTFHWKCIFEDSPIPSEEALKCKVCQLAGTPSKAENGIE